MKRLIGFLGVFFIVSASQVFAQSIDSFVDVFNKLAKEKGVEIPSTLEKKAFEFSTIIKPGDIATFKMGSEKGGEDEKPVHDVTLTEPFEMQRTEVTQLQWVLVMGEHPSSFHYGNIFNIDGKKGCISINRPVEEVSYNDVQKFIKKLNELDKKYEYRLPTEAEWEYTARGGAETEYSFGDEASKLGDYAWYKDNSGKRTHDVALKKPNQYGLYDMHGNVWEWVYDWYKAYSAQDRYIGPKGPRRVLRGGGWDDDAGFCRLSIRGSYWPSDGYYYGGFRLVRTKK